MDIITTWMKVKNNYYTYFMNASTWNSKKLFTHVITNPYNIFGYFRNIFKLVYRNTWHITTDIGPKLNITLNYVI